MNERLLREWINENLLLEGSALTKGEMSKYAWRYEKFLEKINSQTPFEIEAKHSAKYDGAASIVIPAEGNETLVAALKSGDSAAYEIAFKTGVKALADGTTPITLTAAGHLNKDADFGGRGGIPLSIQNEIDFANAVNEYSQTAPITVAIGKYQVSGVVGAEQAGQQKVPVVGFDADGNEVTSKETSKADVNLSLEDGSIYPVSIKMPNAVYWLSGDSKLKLMDKFDTILQILENQPAPDPRIVLDEDGKNYRMVSGPEENPQTVSLSFTLPSSVAMDAVFGNDQNSVGIIAKGDFITTPAWDPDTSTLTWGEGKVFRREDGLEGLPESEKPMGLLRKGEKKKGGIRRGTSGYPGIRPTVASTTRTRSTINIDSLVAFQGADIAEVRAIIREFLLTEELTKTDVEKIAKSAIEKDRAEQKRIIKKEIESELKSSLGTSFFGNPGKVRKAIEEIVQDELSRSFAGGGKMKDQVADITKAVLKKMYREISHSYNPVIDRIRI